MPGFLLRSEKILYGCQARPAGIGLRVLFLMMHNLPTRADLGRLSPTRVLSQRGIRGAHQGSKCEFAQIEGRVAKTRSSQWIQWKFDPIGHSFLLLTPYRRFSIAGCRFGCFLGLRHLDQFVLPEIGIGIGRFGIVIIRDAARLLEVVVILRSMYE